MGTFAPILWLMLRRPHAVMAASVVLYVAARHFEWNLPAYPAGSWYFNPFCWQLLFVFGAWCALGGAAEAKARLQSKVFVIVGAAYLLLALVMTFAGRFEEFGDLFPRWLYDAFNPNDKTNLAPYRFVHFVVIAYLVTRFLPKTWPGLEWKVFDPMIKSGQQSLEVFCVGVFLSFVAHFMLTMSSGSLMVQVGVSVVGIAALTAVAYYRDWSKKQDKPPTRAKPAPAQVAPGSGVA
jgi:hypothetical protein